MKLKILINIQIPDYPVWNVGDEVELPNDNMFIPLLLANEPHAIEMK